MKVIDFFAGFLFPLESIWVFLFFLESHHQWQEITDKLIVLGLVEKIASLPYSYNTQKVEKDQRQSMLGICIILKEKRAID